MNQEIDMLLELVNGSNKEKQKTAFLLLLEMLEEKVEWTYEIWDILTGKLESPDEFERAGAAQMLSYLSVSDPEKRIMKVMAQIMDLTSSDSKAARETMLSTWRIGLAGPEVKKQLLQLYEVRYQQTFDEGRTGQNIRHDILKNIYNLYLMQSDEALKNLMLYFIELEKKRVTQHHKRDYVETTYK